MKTHTSGTLSTHAPKLYVPAFLLLLSSASQAWAAFVTYTDRAAWQAAAGPIIGSENFNSFVADTAVDPAPAQGISLDGGMTLTGLSAGTIIDAPPLSNELECSADGSALICTSNQYAPILKVDAPIGAFGADFTLLQDSAIRTAIELYSGDVLLETFIPPQVADLDVHFLGIIGGAGEAFDQVRFVQIGFGDTFGIDNIEIAGTVPVPAAAWLFGSGLAGLAGMARRNKVQRYL